MSNPPNMPRHASELAQVRALTEAFFARFFESDSTTERTDPTRSFLWLVAVLGAPGLLMTFYRQFAWENLARHDGQGALLLAARFDTSLYLSLTFVAIAVVAAARWQSLLVDRRDTLVLGVLPARPRTIVVSQLLALAGYAVLLAAGMHLASAALYGIGLGSLQRPTNVVRTLAAHLAASVGLTVFVIAAVAAVQAAGLVIVGPRRFARTAVMMQMALIAVALLAFAAMPGRSERSFATFDASGVVGPDWTSWLAPLWFVGLYESILGSEAPGMRPLAGFALVALAAAVSALAVLAPVAGYRVLRETLDAGWPPRPPATRRLAAVLTRVLARAPANRGAVQFALATMGRVAAPRLMLALFGAVGLMGLAPLAAALTSAAPAAIDATTTILAAPFVMLFFLLLGLRLAMKSPVELSGRWLFDQTDLSPLAGRNAAWSTALVLGVLPPVLVTAVLWTWLWGPSLGLARTLSAFAGGLLALEVFFWGYVGVPCSRPAVSSAFRGRSLGLAVGFEVLCFESAAAQAGWQHRIDAVLGQALFFAVAAAAVHAGSRRASAVNAVVDEHLDPRLDLEVVGPLTPLNQRPDRPGAPTERAG